MILSFLLIIDFIVGERISDIKDKTDLQYSYEIVNDVCDWNVSSNYTETNISARTTDLVQKVLQVPCSEYNIYQISLDDPFHYEYLEINQNATIEITGGFYINTIWKINESSSYIISLQQGNLTLSKIGFQFNVISDSSISPISFLIHANGTNEYLSSIQMNDCSFKTVQGSKPQTAFQMYVANCSKINISFCQFNGQGLNYESNISMILMGDSPEIFIKNCIFQDALLSNTRVPVGIIADEPDMNILIQDCQFLRLNSTNTQNLATVNFNSRQNLKATIARNNFTNCFGIEESLGALHIIDLDFNSNLGSEYIVNNNKFSNNDRFYTGGISLVTSNPNSVFNFNNNNFSNNKNNDSEGVGKDAFLAFFQVPDDWNSSNTKDKIINIFNESKSDAKNNSVWYNVTLKNKTQIIDTITLSKLPHERKIINLYAIFGIAVGSLVIVVVIIVIIIVIHKQVKKKKMNERATLQERRYLIYKGSLRSI